MRVSGNWRVVFRFKDSSNRRRTPYEILMTASRPQRARGRRREPGTGRRFRRGRGRNRRAAARRHVPDFRPPGGLKQIIACLTTQAFTSHFFGYRPYSGLIGPEDSRELAEGRRVVVIAKPADALDFEWMEFRTFQMKRITSSCWILVREPLDRAVARQVIEERLSS